MLHSILDYLASAGGGLYKLCLAIGILTLVLSWKNTTVNPSTFYDHDDALPLPGKVKALSIWIEDMPSSHPHICRLIYMPLRRYFAIPLCISQLPCLIPLQQPLTTTKLMMDFLHHPSTLALLPHHPMYQ